jgi:hypothetical protein
MASKFQLAYKKNSNKKLFASMEHPGLMRMTRLQNFIPLYSRFFVLNPQNYDSINLNHRFHLTRLDQSLTYNAYMATVKDTSQSEDVTKETKIFCKFSPLLDVPKYLAGHYAHDVLQHGLPQLTSDATPGLHAKMHDVNNMSYVDSFFCYLSSQLLHHHRFEHGVDFYGSFLGFKQDAMFNIVDDMEYLMEEPLFVQRLGQEFTLENPDMLAYVNHDTRRKKQKINVMDTSEDVTLELDSLDAITEQLDFIVVPPASPETTTSDLVLDYEMVPRAGEQTSLLASAPEPAASDTSSFCSSRSSNSNSSQSIDDDETDVDGSDENDDEFKDANSEPGSAMSEEDEDDDEDEVCNVQLKEYPVQVMAMEHCEGTLHSLLFNNMSQIKEEHWDSMVMQILMMLITYQKAFDFTHNDLHTNNIVYKRTQEQFLYYEYNGKVYRVPVYGYVLKIIDFGRAVYKFNGQTLMSDSYQRDGDAFSMYNCEPYFNPKKPELLPNPSFDLCRLGCALFDMIMDEEDMASEDADADDDNKTRPEIMQIMLDWCLDDKQRNVLYKKNGEERYPDFKLYKMIARTVHNHTPQAVLAKPYFDKYILKGKKLSKFRGHELPTTYMNIDQLPTYVI